MSGPKKCKKECEANKICNEKTGRCVFKNGDIGEKILGVSRNGILLNNVLINKISGPTSLIILKPKIKDYEKRRLPIFILFGDVHRSNENLCHKCFCGIKNKNCCYPIYSKSFLKILDSLGTDKNYPIDFSIEGGISENLLYNESDIKKVKKYYANIKYQYPLNKVRDDYKICYNKKIKEKHPKIYKSKCPTYNIRWQNVDARFHRYNDYNYDFENFLDKIYDIFFIDKILTYEVIINLSKKFPLYIEYLNIIKHIFDYNFYDYIYTKRSSVFKQLKKIQDPKIRKNWEKMSKEYYKYIIDTYHLNIPVCKTIFIKYIDYIIKIYEHTDEYNIENFNDHIINLQNILGTYKKNISGQLLYLNSALLDLYFLARTFKIPEGSEKTFISIGYFGQVHIDNITYYLTDIMKEYDIVYSIGDKFIKIKSNVKRCIEIDKYIDLQSIIDSYKK